MNTSIPALVSVIILNWNHPHDTIECARSVLQSDYPRYNIIVVDNASLDDSIDRILAIFPDLTLIANAENLGYAGGNNVGICHALSNQADYVLLLNDDTTIEPDTISHLVAAMHDPTIAAMGSKIRSAEQPTRLWSAGRHFFHTRPLPEDDGTRDTPHRIKFAVGCCVLIRSAVLREIGLLQEEYFAYVEDIEWCHRARSAGYKIMYEPAAVAYHRIARSTSATYSPLYHYLNTRNWLHFTTQRNATPSRAHHLLYTVKVVGRQFLIIMQTGGFDIARIMATTRGAIDYWRGQMGPPPPL